MNKKADVYIIGASGFGREIESWASLSMDFRSQYSLKGYLDDNLNALYGYTSDYKIVGKIDEFKFKDDDLVLLGIADPVVKENIVNRLKDKVKYLSFVFCASLIGKGVKIGEGTIIGPNCFLTSNINIGRFVSIILGTVVGHDSIISDFASLMVHVTINGNVLVGKSVFIGSNAVIPPGKSIGENSSLSPGSVVINDVPDNSLVFGNPAKHVRKFFK